MKKMALSFAVVSLLLGACSNNSNTISKKDEVIQKIQKKSMIPRTAVSKDYYRTVIPLKEQKVINTANIKQILN